MDKQEVKIKKKIVKGLILSSTILFILPICLLSCSVMMIASIMGANEDELINSTVLSAEYTILAKQICEENGYELSKLLALSTAIGEGIYNDETLNKAITKINQAIKPNSYEESLYKLYKKIYGEIKTSPIAKKSEYKIKVKDVESDEWYELDKTRQWSYSHYNDFGADRSYGGERKHLGNDILADLGTPVTSMTDGVISRIGWDELGGWRIGITDTNDTYWYYAHMQKYEKDMRIGKAIKAGEVIGFVGSSGYGKEGTTGKFPTHLHLQIGITIDGYKDYIWINPYEIVRFTEPYRVTITKKVEE